MTSFLNAMTGSEAPPPVQIMQLATSHFSARCLHVVAATRIADHVDDVPKPATRIATSAGVNADALERIFRLLSMHGLFRFESGGWAHTPASSLLKSDNPFSMRDFVAMIGDGSNWGALERFSHSLKSGAPAADLLHPKGIWGWYAEHPAEARQFDAAMTAKSHADIAMLAASLDVRGVNTLADIGGGRGHFLRALLDAHPNIKGVLFDQPEVAAAAADHPRMTKQGGDFFKGGLPSADLYLMTHIIHDWDDPKSIAILKSVRAAAAEGARLVLYEMRVPEGAEPHPARVLDIVMMAVTGGRERTPQQYGALLSAAGWRFETVIDTPGLMALHCARAV